MVVPRMELALRGALLSCLALAGCRGGDPPPFVRYAPEPDVPRQLQAGSNAFDDYALASEKILAFEGVSKLGNRAVLYEEQRHLVQKAVINLLPQLERAAAIPCEFKEPAITPFARGKYHEGWRLIGLGLQWEIQESAQREDYDRCVRLANIATKMGVDLCGGSALDASQGMGIANGARIAIAPLLEKLSVAQLDRLGAELKRAMAKMPAFDITMSNELKAMLTGVQYIQDAYQKQEFDELETTLGPGVRDAVDYLREVHGKDAKERPKYFAGFADEARKEAADVVAWSKKAAASRPTAEELVKADEAVPYRPWKRLAPHFLRGSRSLLPVRDAFLARTRLMIQECQLLKLQKSGKPLPETIPLPDPTLATDPYTGSPLKYRRRGNEFELYSVGPNFEDDAGVIGTDFTSPDLGIEKSR